MVIPFKPQTVGARRLESALGGVRRLLNEQGPLSGTLAGFTPRAAQQAMAEAVAQAMADYTTLVVEAGTGVGKTFAYLIPTLLSGETVLIATATRNLQDQLYHDDLPRLCAALGVKVSVALLKGRANYLCRYRLKAALAAIDTPTTELVQIAHWAQHTETGDIAELSNIAEDAPVWPRVTSTVDNCLGQTCADYPRCCVAQARREALKADILVVNHHLLCADLALKEEGFGDILPSVATIIVDEAHRLPDIATEFFGASLRHRQLLELAQDAYAEPALEISGREAARALDTAAVRLRSALGPLTRRNWLVERDRPEVKAALAALQAALTALDGALTTTAASPRRKALEGLSCRTNRLIARLQLFSEDISQAVQWVETTRRGFVLHHAPLDAAAVFQARLKALSCAWILTSATLAVGGDFRYFTTRLGLADATCLRLESPYDYAHHALLYLPAGLPEPQELGHTHAMLKAALPVIHAAGGRTFMLFTSHRALREAWAYLGPRLEFPLLVQGTAPRHRLIEAFRCAGNAVLLGTGSFWEGVDVRGRALSCVIIDKLPFAMPDDPVLEARLDAVRERGGNPFFEIQLPQAVIGLKQGIGRLIRHETDRGVLMVCDPRLKTRGYGKVFLNSLPRLPVTDQLQDVRNFLALMG